MKPIFIQTDRHLIDLSKVTHAELDRKGGRVKFCFVGGGSVLLSRAEAHRVLVATGELSTCGANAPVVLCMVGGGE